jgi:hypothetical protein
MISGFMIVKNVLEQGYPFVEAIASALPICDEFLISDGYSIDGTYETIKKISNLNPKVQVFRYQWPEKKDINVLSEVTNELRKKCRFEYIFSVQANEIIHEQNLPTIKALPSMFPNVETFSFPYVQLLNKYKLTEEFRLRFAKNLPRIIAIGDAWTLGTSKDFEKVKKLRSFANPHRLLGYVNNGIWHTYANSCWGRLSRAVYLPKPIFRYWSLFPKDFLEKYQRHKQLFELDGFRECSEALQSNINSPEIFWRLGSDVLGQTKFKERPLYPDPLNSIDKNNHPAIIQDFISNPNINQYYIRENLFAQISKL